MVFCINAFISLEHSKPNAVNSHMHYDYFTQSGGNRHVQYVNINTEIWDMPAVDLLYTGPERLQYYRFRALTKTFHDKWLWRWNKWFWRNIVDCFCLIPRCLYFHDFGMRFNNQLSHTQYSHLQTLLLLWVILLVIRHLASDMIFHSNMEELM